MKKIMVALMAMSSIDTVASQTPGELVTNGNF